ncbi:hypothetical protein [Streptomyces sp. NPDC003247]|uniref:hypothetical protein n=1 Tax=Streptomyces sp. NPDC003247 TaxID=3364677 RepID=UPI0036945827
MQAAAVEAFVLAWWRHVLASPDPPYPVPDVFETCAMILGTVTGLFDRWEPGPVPDAHLARCAGAWLDELATDRTPFSWWSPDDGPAVVAEQQAWLARHAPDRLRAVGETDLAVRAALLGLPHDERWAHPYWCGAAVTD